MNTHQTVEIAVFTFKEGLFSGLAHDLKIVGSATVVSTEPLELSLDTESFEVQCAMQAGRESPVLTRLQREEIKGLLETKVLQAHKNPLITLQVVSRTENSFTANLTLNGVAGPVAGSIEASTAFQEVIFEVDQRAFNIVPFEALFGALKVKPVVRIVAKLPI
jgi:YceI-like domain